MRLIDIPMTEMQTTKNWVVGLTGKRGTITGFTSIPSGIQLQLVIHIEWECGRKTEYNYPDDVGNIVVREEKIPHKLEGYMNFRKDNMLEQIDYFEKFLFVAPEEDR